jgi:hypothetical protein
MAAGDLHRRTARNLNAAQRERVLHLLDHRRQWQRGRQIHEELLELKIVVKEESWLNPRVQSARLTTFGRKIAAEIQREVRGVEAAEVVPHVHQNDSDLRTPTG